MAEEVIIMDRSRPSLVALGYEQSRSFQSPMMYSNQQHRKDNPMIVTDSHRHEWEQLLPRFSAESVDHLCLCGAFRRWCIVGFADRFGKGVHVVVIYLVFRSLVG